MTPVEAKELYAQIRRVYQLRRLLAGTRVMTDDERNDLVEELNTLVANLHE